jgi:WD repeat-containing protein 26
VEAQVSLPILILAYPWADMELDGKVYIWHRYLEQLVHVLEGHKEMVNSVAWHPTHPHMLASASDDRTVRM